MATLRALVIPPGPSALSLLAALEGILDGRDAPMIPVPAGDLRESELLTRTLRVGEEIDENVALVIATSGTTSAPKGAMLTPAALIAGAAATHDRLGGPGTWLLALPPHHIAGMQVLVRSVLAGTVPAELDVSAGFDTAELPRAVAELGAGRRYTSLVSNQLAKSLADPAAAAALAELDAVLLGGGPAPATLLTAAYEAGITVVRTYGSSETAGGCVYDGVPLDGVEVRIDDPDPAGVGGVVIGGATLAIGYRNPPDEGDPFAEPGWYRTDDLGMFDEAGQLRVLGRSDDSITTGGLVVMPAVVEAVLSRHPAVAECAVFGVADDRLGERVVAAVVAAVSELPDRDELTEFVRRSLDRTAAPREIHFVEDLPRRGIGKLDRRALRERFGTP